jgi:hypothetical protein
VVRAKEEGKIDQGEGEKGTLEQRLKGDKEACHVEVMIKFKANEKKWSLN